MKTADIRFALSGSTLLHESVVITLVDETTHEVHIDKISDKHGTASILYGDINGWEWFVWNEQTWNEYVKTWPDGTFDGYLVAVSATEAER
jgi:hypothetical protein